MSEYDFFQIDATGVSEPDTATARAATGTPIRRAIDSKISIFGTNVVGNRMSSDYTRTDLAFQAKDELSDYKTITKDEGVGSNVGARSTTVNHNPYLVGSTVKRVRDDQFTRMGMSNNRGASVDAPKFDIMDTNLVSASDIVSGKNWPSEGWRSYGGKYDFEYTGGGIH